MSSGIMRHAREPDGRLSVRLGMFRTAVAIRRLSEMRQAAHFDFCRNWEVQVGQAVL